MNKGGVKIILGSASPRRQQLLTELFPAVEVRIKEVEENFSPELQQASIPLFLAEQKAKAFNGELNDDEILITADTIVWFDGHVLNKPTDRKEALAMLQKLAGNSHDVFTGVCISSKTNRRLFSIKSTVTFNNASEAELLKYIDQYKPYDKAGAYGAQECLPENMNPLSEKEKNFLSARGKPDLFEKSLAVKGRDRIHLIRTINGSYFNVMGLPVTELCENLHEYFGIQ